MSRRRFIDAPQDFRCLWEVTLRDGSKAQCGRYVSNGQLCTQHAKMHAAWPVCEYCGNNDELPPGHCMDCTRPAEPAAP